MTNRLAHDAFALLDHFVPENEALAGDLREEFEAGRSTWWLWRQVAAAVFIAAYRRPQEIRPLRLVDGQLATVRHDQLHRSAAYRQRRAIDRLSGITGVGVGGLGMVIFGATITIVMPQAWWLVVIGIVSGVLVGIIRIVLTRQASKAGPYSSHVEELFPDRHSATHH